MNRYSDFIKAALRSSKLIIFVLIVLALPLMSNPKATVQAATGEIVEFALPTPGTQPFGITPGPDGTLWFTAGTGIHGESFIAKITTDGVVTEFPTRLISSYLPEIVLGPDRNLWFTSPDSAIGRITSAGEIVEFPLPPPASRTPWDITLGPDGALWFTELLGNRIGRITTSGQVSEFALPSFVPVYGVRPLGIVAGPDGNLWFTELLNDKIGKITPTGTITEFPLPTIGGQPTGITLGPDGALWFTLWGVNAIGRITLQGEITSFPVVGGANPFGITSGPDGALWFTEEFSNRVNRITTSGVITQFPFPTGVGGSRNITVGPDGNIWFTELHDGKIGRLTLRSYNLCLQDDSNGNLLQINATTGEYQFTNCAGLTIGGTGTLTKRGNQITLQHNAADRRVMASVDTSTKRATASIQLLSQGRTFSITDRNITNNTCACR